MNETIEFVSRHGYPLIFVGVLIEQLGVPLPVLVLLIAAGALAGIGQLSLILVILVAVIAALIGDTIWFYIGRRRGLQVLGLLCRLSLEQDSCVSGAKGIFLRHGARSLLAAKFIPGFSTFAQPLAGATGISIRRFLIFDTLGAILYAAVYASLGYLFSDQFERVIEYVENFGWWLGAAIIVGLIIYIGWKIVSRQRLIYNLRVARITPEELKNRLDNEDEMLILDLRNALDFAANPQLIPTAKRIAPDELEEKHTDLPRNCDVILYCTCPNEATSAKTALRLHKRGFKRVRPLAGGFEKWGKLMYPIA